MGVQATGDPLMVMADPLMGVQAMGVQATCVPPTHLARSSIPACLTDALIQKVIETMGAPASAKISAIRHRCCLAFPDVRPGSVDP
jgi:hypothetical protein